MNELLQTISAFTMGSTVWVYLFIFFGKIVEVTFATVRMILINRGIRTIGALMALVEITLWLLIASSVLSGFHEDWLKGVAYALAYAAGNYLGSWMDEWFAFGLSSLQVIIADPDTALRVRDVVRQRGFGVTSLRVTGIADEHIMLMLTMKRKRVNEAISCIEKECPHAVISVSDIKSQRGGYMTSRFGTRAMRVGK